MPQLPSAFDGGGKDSFVYLIQRLSDRNYAMRSLCLENSGARYTSFSLPNITRRCVHWIPDSNLNDHANDSTIVDVFHTDLFDPNKRGEHFFTPEALLECTNSNTECLFLTNLEGDFSKNRACSKAIAEALEVCSSNLKCITINSCCMKLEVLESLAKCPELRGITIDYCQMDGATDDKLDSALAKVLTSCPNLRWLYITYFPFFDKCWTALDSGACPDLQVLWTSRTISKDGRECVTAGDHDMIRRVLTERKLPLYMINPDEKLKSSFILFDSKKKTYDRLNGKKAEPMPDFESYYNYDDYGGDY